MESKYNEDYNKEVLLGKYLDTLYTDLFPGLTIERINDFAEQHNGVDLIISKGDDRYIIDEKAQLDYIDKTLPTFAFEITYLKGGQEILGWLFDKRKKTHKYFVITGIYLNVAGDISQGF